MDTVREEDTVVIQSDDASTIESIVSTPHLAPQYVVGIVL
jgi:hypothetical protein